MVGRDKIFWGCLLTSLTQAVKLCANAEIVADCTKGVNINDFLKLGIS